MNVDAIAGFVLGWTMASLIGALIVIRTLEIKSDD